MAQHAKKGPSPKPELSTASLQAASPYQFYTQQAQPPAKSSSITVTFGEGGSLVGTMITGGCCLLFALLIALALRLTYGIATSPNILKHPG